MESQQPRKDNPSDDDQQEKSTTPNAGHLTRLSTIDTSRPFRSVKEAVEIFGERFLAREICSTTPKPLFIIPKEEIASSNIAPPKPISPLFASSSVATKLEHGDDFATRNILKKLEVELEETKHELELLKKRESQMEIVVASLKSELHKNMLKMAEAEAKTAGEKTAAASEATISTSTTPPVATPPRGNRRGFLEEHDDVTNEDDHEYMYLKSLAEVLSLGENEGYFGSKKKKKKTQDVQMMNMKKVKPIIPLVGDLISWKIKSSS